MSGSLGLRALGLRPLDSRRFAALVMLRPLALFNLALLYLALFHLAVFRLPLGRLPHRILRALGPFTFLLLLLLLLLLRFARGSLVALLTHLIFGALPLLPSRHFALLRILTLLPLAHLSVSIHTHAIGNAVRLEYR